MYILMAENTVEIVRMIDLYFNIFVLTTSSDFCGMKRIEILSKNNMHILQSKKIPKSSALIYLFTFRTWRVEYLLAGLTYIGSGIKFSHVTS